MATGKKGNAWERERSRCAERSGERKGGTDGTSENAREWRREDEARPYFRVTVALPSDEASFVCHSMHSTYSAPVARVCVCAVYARARACACVCGASMPIVRHGAFIFGLRVGRVRSWRSPMCARVWYLHARARRCVRAEGVSGSSGFIIRHCAPS